MAGRDAQRFRPRHGAENRDAALREGVAQESFVRRARHPVEDDAGDGEARPVVGEPLRQGRDRSTLAAGVDHERDGQAQAGREVGCRAGAVAGAVEQAHRALAQDERSVGAERRDAAGERRRAHRPGVEVHAVMARRQSVVARIDVVRPRLEGPHGMAVRPQMGEQSGAEDGLAAAGSRRGEDDTATHPSVRSGRYRSISTAILVGPWLGSKCWTKAPSGAIR